MKTLKKTERGWAGHFIASQSCGFRRNTLLEYGNKKWIVSTVGNYRPNLNLNKTTDKDNIENQIGVNRFYETMAFEAQKKGSYFEIRTEKEIPFKSNWALDELEVETDLKADAMHEKVVAELSKKIQNVKTN